MTSDSKENRIRMTIVGGFLGAGKSTWLRHQIFEGAYRGSIVVVNEIGSIAVDDILLQEANQLHVLAGKCACCDGQDQMIELLRNICNERTNDQTMQSDELIFEMTGVADPEKVLEAIEGDPVLARHILLTQVTVVADGLDGFDQLNREPLARKQIEAADRILISKGDMTNSVELSQLKSVLSTINPSAAICGIKHGVEYELTNLPIVETPKLRNIGELEDQPIVTTQITLHSDEFGHTDWAGFSVWLSAMLHKYGQSLVRVKGVVHTPAGRLLLQSVRQRIQSPEILPPASSENAKMECRDNKITLIGRGLCQNGIAHSIEQILGR